MRQIKIKGHLTISLGPNGINIRIQYPKGINNPTRYPKEVKIERDFQIALVLGLLLSFQIQSD